MVHIVFKDGQVREFYFTTKISDNVQELENGFLRCNNVIMGRTGIQYYGDTAINRLEEDVFHPDTLLSIEGKTVTLTHPEDFVDTKNVKDLEIGYILNARRDGDNIVGDIIITDSLAIEKILNNEMRELSLGYQSKVVDDGNGGWKQTEIVVNHLAVVSKGRAGNAMIVDHADDNTNTMRKENGLVENLSFGQKVLQFLGIKKATFSDDSVIEILDEESKKVDNENSKENEDESSEKKDKEENAKDSDEEAKDGEGEKKEDEDEEPKKDTKDSQNEKVNDDYSSKRTTITKEEFESEYGKTQRLVKTEEQEVHKDKDENENEKGEINDMKITLDSALARMKELEALKGTEAYEVQLKLLDAECVEAGIGSIIVKKKDDNKAGDIFKDVDPKKNVKDEEDKKDMLPKFTGKAFNKNIQNIYDGFSPRAMNKVQGSVLDRTQAIKDKSDYEISDFVR